VKKDIYRYKHGGMRGGIGDFLEVKAKGER
jgi:hypothetical protein